MLEQKCAPYQMRIRWSERKRRPVVSCGWMAYKCWQRDISRAPNNKAVGGMQMPEKSAIRPPKKKCTEILLRAATNGEASKTAVWAYRCCQINSFAPYTNCCTKAILEGLRMLCWHYVLFQCQVPAVLLTVRIYCIDLRSSWPGVPCSALLVLVTAGCKSSLDVFEVSTPKCSSVAAAGLRMSPDSPA